MLLERIGTFIKNVFAEDVQNTSLFPSDQYLYQFKKTDPTYIISANKALLNEAAHVLQLDALSFQTMLKPIIEYLAKYCLLLTASNDYHHKEPGSFFYHLIETANIAAKEASNRPDLMSHIPLEDRASYEIVNPMAAWIMGILHDIAKPMTDFDILLYSRSKKPIDQRTPWRPDEETLYDYITRHNAGYYQVLYSVDKQYHLHEQQQMLFISKMLSFFPPESQYRNKLKGLLTASISTSHPINQLVKNADRKSTKLDTLRRKPYPVVKDWAKAFLDELQMFDRIKRTSNDVPLPYFFSELGIHITYPTGFRRLLLFVEQRYKNAEGERMPVDPDAWIMLLGSHHSVLVPNHASHSYFNPKYEDIRHFVYSIIVGDSNKEERVVTISYESIYLDRDPKPAYKSVRFSTFRNADSIITKADVTDSSEAEETNTPENRPINCENKTPENSFMHEEPLMVQMSFESESESVEELQLKFPEESKKQPETTSSANIDNSPIATFSDQAILDTASLDVGKPDYEKQTVKEEIQLIGSTNETQADHLQLGGSKRLKSYDEFRPLIPKLNFSIKDPEYALHDMASQIPEEHVISALVNSFVPLQKNYPIINWLLFIFNDINQYSLNDLTEAGLNYGFTNAGFAVNQGYLNDAIQSFSTKYELSNAVSNCVKNAIKALDKDSETNHIIFYKLSGRMRVFTPVLAKGMLYRYKEELIPLINDRTLTLGENDEG